MKNLLLIITLTTAIYGCCKEEVKEQILPEQIVLEPKVHNLSKEVVANSIFILNNKIITYEVRPIDFFFQVFDFDTKQHLYSFGSKGKANNEFIQIDRILRNGNLLEISNIDQTLKSVYFGDSCATIKKIAKPVRFGIDLRNTYNPERLNDSIYLVGNVNCKEDNMQFAWYNINNGEKTPFGQITESDFFESLCHSGKILLNKKEKKIAMFYSSNPIYEIVDFDGKRLKQHTIKGSISNKKMIANARNRDPQNILSLDVYIQYFNQFYATDKYIFAEYLNNTLMDALKNTETNLIIFDWDGNVVGNLLSKERMRSYTVSEDGTTLYASIIKNPNMLYEYKLPGFK